MADHTDSSVPNFADMTKEKLSEVMDQPGRDARKFIENNFDDGMNTIIRKLHTSKKKGVMGFEEALAHRREVFGANVVPLKPAKNFLNFIVAAMSDWMLLVLAIGGILSLILGLVFPEKCDEYDKVSVAWYEGVGILVMIILMIFISALGDYVEDSDYRSQTTRVLLSQKVLVMRDGHIKEIERHNLTVGDLCIVEVGSVIPGDGIIVQSIDLKVNELALANGSVVDKDVEGDTLVYSGTHVTKGSARFLVLAVGEFTKIHQAAMKDKGSRPTHLDINIDNENDTNTKENLTLLRRRKENNATLQGKINKVAVVLGYIGIGIAAVTMIVIMIRFSVYTYSQKGQTFQHWHINEYIRAFIMGLVVLVVSIPEGLQLATTSAVAFCTKMMYVNRSLVKNKQIIEAMGNITNICCNKTGVLTEHRMHVTKVYTTNKQFEGDPRYYKDNIPSNLFLELVKGISINTSYASRIIPSKTQGELDIQAGNMTDCAVLQFVVDVGETYQHWRDEHPEESFKKLFEFTPTRKSMTTVTKPENGVYKVYSKGAAEVLLPKCVSTYSTDGQLKPFEKDDMERVLKEVVDPLQQEALKILCIASKGVLEGDINFEDENEVVSGLTLLAIVGIEDPVREEVPAAIDKCSKAGIRVCMVSGDNVNTARAVAVKCGIIKPNEESLIYDGQEFNKYIRDPDGQINPERFNSMWPKLRVLARSSARDKYTLVKGIMDSPVHPQGEIVAVTGSGIHDGPVLRKADVGFTMGVAGSDVAKENADVILLDDNFGSIVWAVKWGRNVFNTVTKFLQFQFIITWSSFIVIVIGACILGRSPLGATQLLWINLIMDSLASFTLTRDIPSDDILGYKPYGRHKPLLGRSLVRNVVGHVFFQIVISFILIFLGDDMLDIEDGFQEETLCKPSMHSSLVFTSFVFMQLFNQINCREVHGRNVFQGIHRNVSFVVIWIAEVVVQILIVEVLTKAFHTSPMDLDMWLWCVFFGVSQLIWAQIVFSIPKTWLPMFVRCGTTGSTKGRNVTIMRNTSRVSQKMKYGRSYEHLPSEAYYYLKPTTPSGVLPNTPEDELWRGPSMEKLEVIDRQV